MKPEYSVESGKNKIKLNNRKKQARAKQIQLRYCATSRIQTQLELRLFQLTQIDKVRRVF